MNSLNSKLWSNQTNSLVGTSQYKMQSCFVVVHVSRYLVLCAEQHFVKICSPLTLLCNHKPTGNLTNFPIPMIIRQKDNNG